MSSSDLAQWLLEATLAVTAAIAIASIVRRPIRRSFGANAAYACWLLVPVMLIAVSLPAMRVTNAESAIAALQIYQKYDTLPEASRTAGAIAASGVFPDLTPSFWILLAWLIGAFAMLWRLVSQQRAFQRDLGHLAIRQDGALQADHDAGLPAVVGLWRPHIVLPSDFDRRFDAQERQVMLAHERSHIAAGDLQANALAAVLHCVFWFHPFARYAYLRFRQDQEVACDARVMRAYPASRRIYGEAMLKAQLTGMPLPIGCHWAPIHPIKERIQMLKQPLPSTRWLGGSMLVAMLTLGAGAAAWSAQPSRVVSLATAVSSIPAGKVAVEAFFLNGAARKVVYRNVVSLDENFGFDFDAQGVRWHIEAVASPAQQPGALQLLGEAVAAGKIPMKIAQTSSDGGLRSVTLPDMNSSPILIRLTTRDAKENQALFYSADGIKKVDVEDGQMSNASKADIKVNALKQDQSARVIAKQVVLEVGKTIEGEEFLCNKPINVAMSGVSSNVLLQMLADECGAKVTFMQNAVRFSK